LVLIKYVMKKLLFVFFIILTSLACENNCENQPEACTDILPNEDCEAYFMRWFYDDGTNTCSEIGYSGCEQYGFEAQAECEACLCVE